MIEELIKKIQSYGYWKVIIRPNKHVENLIPTLIKCKELVEDNKLKLRGWDYPHIDSSGVKFASDNSVHSYCDWPDGPMFEYWRFYQTGQFVHYFSMREDLRMSESKKKELQDEFGNKIDIFLSILSTLYSVTEIYAFASKLFSEIEQVEGIEITIELHGVNNRMLTFWDNFGRHLSQPYICEFPEGVLKINKLVDRKFLIDNYKELALDATIEIFNKFNWVGANKQIFREDQKKLLERRL